MELEKPLLEFINGIVSTKATLAKSMGEYISADQQHKLTVHYHLSGASTETKLRVNRATNEVQVRVEIFNQSDMAVYFWLVWGFIRTEYNTEMETDAAALPLTFAAFTNATRKELSTFYQEFNDMLGSRPTEANIKRSETSFEFISDKLVNTFNNSDTESV